MAKKLDKLTEQDFLSIERQMINIGIKSKNYVCERQQRLNKEAIRKIKEYMQNYLNSEYHSTQRHD